MKIPEPQERVYADSQNAGSVIWVANNLHGAKCQEKKWVSNALLSLWNVSHDKTGYHDSDKDLEEGRVFNDLIYDFTKSDFKSFSDDLI